MGTGSNEGTNYFGSRRGPLGWILAPANPWKLAIVLTAPLAVILALLVVMLVRWEQRGLAEIQEVGLREVGRAFFDHLKATRIWVSGHGGFYVEVPEHGIGPGKGPDMKDISILGKTYRKVGSGGLRPEVKAFAEQRGLYTFHVTSLKPTTVGSRPDTWEAAALKAFAEGWKREATAVVTQGDRRFFRYMAPLVLDASCLKCHQRRGFKEGAVRGGLSVTIPMSVSDNQYARQVKRSAVQFGALGVVAVLVVIVITIFFSHRISEGFLEKLRQQAALRNLNDLLTELSLRDKKILDSVQDGIVVLDADGAIDLINPVMLRVAGIREQDVMGRTVGELPEGSVLRRVLTLGEPEAGGTGPDLPVLREPAELQIGGKIYVVSSSRVVDRKSGGFFGELRVVHDATREKLSAALELAGTAAHNLRQPLSVIMNLKHLIAGKIADGEGVEEELAVLEEQVIRLDDILKKMLSITTYKQKTYLEETKILDIDQDDGGVS